ncbi:MAG: CarD family transcriptional regulator [Anaerolineales bacterium]|jgi:RNA polymerase-interacting CarD/CdnL/TRCF family regulator
MKPALEEGLDFKIGDQVVHPHHGIGYITDVEEKQFEPNDSQVYYVVSIPEKTLWVPVDLSTSGLRRLSAKSELEKCNQILLAAPRTLTAGRNLLTDLSNQIKQGTIVAQSEVVRDLTAFGWKKPLYGPIADFLRMIMNVLSQEWAAIKGVSQAEASNEIDALLSKGRAAHEH